MDNTDVKILGCLRENARMNASQIGERISMSVSAVIERIKKLEISGIIKQYAVILDPKAIGKHTTAYIFVNLEHPRYNEIFIERMNLHSEVTECHLITGDYDFILKVITSSTQTLENVLDDIKRIKGVMLTRTLVVLRTAKEEFVSVAQ